METVVAFILTRFLELSETVYQNAGLIFFSFFFATVWVTGIITVVRRWEGN